MDFVREMFDFMRARKKYWLVPVIVLLLLIGTVVFVTSGTAVAPFIYTLF